MVLILYKYFKSFLIQILKLIINKKSFQFKLKQFKKYYPFLKCFKVNWFLFKFLTIQYFQWCFQLFIILSFINTISTFSASEVNNCIVSTECKSLLEECKSNTTCNGYYANWIECLNNQTEAKSLSDTTKVPICQFIDYEDEKQELSINCQTSYCSDVIAKNTSSSTFNSLMQCANFCFGVFDDDLIPANFSSEITVQYKELYTYNAQEVKECIGATSEQECTSEIATCQKDATCKTKYETLSSCFAGKTYCKQESSGSSDDPKQRITCPITCSVNITYTKNDVFDQLLQCFSYCYGNQNATYFPEKTALTQYTSLKSTSAIYIPSNVDVCIETECTTSATKCEADTPCKNSYLLLNTCLNSSSLCQYSGNGTNKLWDICPIVCSNNITSSALTHELENCYLYCYGSEFDDNLFEPANTTLAQYEDLYGYVSQPGYTTFDVSSTSYLFCSDLTRCKSERQAIGATVFIIYLVYILYYVMNLNRKLNQQQFRYIESFLFFFGLSALMSVNYLQSGIFHAIFCYLTFVCLLLLFASTVQGNSISEILNKNRKYLWFATLLFMIVWNIGNIIHYYSVGSDHVE